MRYMINIVYDSKYTNFIRVNNCCCDDKDIDSLIKLLEDDSDVIGYSIYKLEKEVRKDEISKSSR